MTLEAIAKALRDEARKRLRDDDDEGFNRLLSLADALDAERDIVSMRCPRCHSVEWFPGAACWHCGWEAGDPNPIPANPKGAPDAR